MIEANHHHGAVYIFENARACRVKIGSTINDVRLRLKDVDRLWSGVKPTCQVCGSRRLTNSDGLLPKHVISGRTCAGSSELPLERDVAVAASHLEKLRRAVPNLAGSEKGSATREIKTLERRIEQFRDYQQPEGIWQFGAAYYTDFAGDVESLSHEILAGHLDTQAPLGEVFCCSVPEAMEAVETALGRMNLLDSVKKQMRDDATSAEYGNCPICGGHLTKRGSCPECAERFRRI